MHARSKGQPSDGQPSCSAQTQQQRQRQATSARQPEARPARPEDLRNTRAKARHTTLGNNWLLKTAKQRCWRPWWWHRRLRHWRQRACTSSKTKAPTGQAAPWPLTTWRLSLYVPVCPPARLAAAAARPQTPAGHRRSDCAVVDFSCNGQSMQFSPQDSRRAVAASLLQREQDQATSPEDQGVSCWIHVTERQWRNGHKVAAEAQE